MPDFAEFLRQSSLTVFTAAALLRDLVKSTWFRSVDLTVMIPAGETSATFPHGLGRAMNGAAIVGNSDATAVCAVAITNELAATHVSLSLAAARITDTTLKLRVY